MESKLEEARRLYETANSDQKYVLESLFSELKESEDEKIRKEIITFIKKRNRSGCDYDYDQWIDWLEKQKEVCNTDDFGDFIDSLSKQFPEISFAKLSRICVRVKNWLEKQGEQKQNTWSEEDEIIIRAIKEAVNDYWADEAQAKTDIFAWLEKQGESFDANTITREDEILQAISVGLSDMVEDFGWSDFGGLPIEEIQDWLEKQGEQKSEWSEEDSKRFQRIIDFLWYNRKGDTDTIYQQEQDIDWLKSLRPQKQWKPSEEQIKMLGRACSTLHLTSGENEVMESLYNDLKQLKQL